MPVEITILSGARQSEKLEISGDRIVVGDQAECDVHFPPKRDPAACGKTGIITGGPDGWRIRNEGMGMWLVNQQLLPPQATSALRSGDIVRLSESGPDFQFSIIVRRATAGIMPPTPVPAEPFSPSAQAASPQPPFGPPNSVASVDDVPAAACPSSVIPRAAPEAAPNRLLPGLEAAPAAASVRRAMSDRARDADTAEPATGESEAAEAIVPIAARRAAASTSTREELRAKPFAVLVTASGAAVFLVAIAIVFRLASRSDDTPQNHAKPKDRRPATLLAPTTPGRTAEPETANQRPPSAGKPDALGSGAANSTPELERPGAPSQPTPDEVRTLGASLQRARNALGDYRFDVARSELKKVIGLPMWPEHRRKYQRLDVLMQHAEKFHRALCDAVKGLTPGTSIRTGSTELGVVSAAEDSLTVRVAGRNQTYQLSELPPALGLAIADQFIEQHGDGAPAFKAAYLITHKNATDAQLAKAREWWKSAKTHGGRVADLERALDDEYDLEDDLE